MLPLATLLGLFWRIFDMPNAGRGSLEKLLRVLIVEDEAVIGMLLKETIQSLGHTVCGIANTEDDAVAQADRFQPDLMIVDASLRSGSGVSAIQTIEQTRRVPHIFVTGNARRVQALRPGAIVLEKPFFNEDLATAIERALAVEAVRIGAIQ
jgi:two-component system, response regulator PdtaR